MDEAPPDASSCLFCFKGRDDIIGEEKGVYQRENVSLPSPGGHTSLKPSQILIQVFPSLSNVTFPPFGS